VGDGINEAVRIEDVPGSGTVPASKHLLERLDADAARSLRVDLDGIAAGPV
jgi:class 3 adenylate cyclase